MNALTNKETSLPQRIESRDAWRILQAEFSNRPDITPDRWRLLAMAFESVSDDLLTTAVVACLRKNPRYFPQTGDIQEQLEILQPPTPRQMFLASMHNLGYTFTHEEVHDHKLFFQHRGTGHVAEVMV